MEANIARVRKRCPLENDKEVNVFEYCPSEPGNCDICPKLHLKPSPIYDRESFIFGTPKQTEELIRLNPIFKGRLEDDKTNRLKIAGVIVTELHKKFHCSAIHVNSFYYANDCDIAGQQDIADFWGINKRTYQRWRKSGRLNFIKRFGATDFSHTSSLGPFKK